MSDIATIITAIVGAAGSAGTGIIWLANRIDKRFKAVEAELLKCRQREALSMKVAGKHLIVIELLWQVASKNKAAVPVLARCKEHLDDLRQVAKGVIEHD